MAGGGDPLREDGPLLHGRALPRSQHGLAQTLTGPSPEQLRELKQSILTRIERFSEGKGFVSEKITRAARIGIWYQLLAEIEANLTKFEEAAVAQQA